MPTTPDRTKPGLTERIADILMVCFSAGSSLKTWAASGRLTRELPFLGVLGDAYGRVVLVTHGDQSDLEYRDAVARTIGADTVVIPTRTVDPATPPNSAAERIAAHVAHTDRVVVQTSQFDDGGLTNTVISALRARAAAVAFVARGRFLLSKLEASERGPHDARAISAGFVESRVAESAQIIIGTNQRMIDDFAWRYGVNPARLRVIPNFIAADRPVTPAHARDPDRLLVAGELIARRRIDQAVRGIAGLPLDQRDRCTLEVIGDGPERRRLERLADSLGVRAEFRGVLEHEKLIEAINRCACYLHPSVHEVTSRILLTAMASGAAVMVANAAGIGDLVENGVNGIVVPGSAESFAYALSGLLPDEDWREMLGASAANVVRTRCAADRVAELTLAAHRDAIESVTSRRAAV